MLRADDAPLGESQAAVSEESWPPEPPKLAPEFISAEQIRYRGRTTVERVFAGLKEELANSIRVRSAAKVMAHLSSAALLALTVDQLFKLTG